MLGTKEHYELLESFEKEFSDLRLDKEEDKKLWAKGIIYESGGTNSIYQAYISGYALGKYCGSE